MIDIGDIITEDGKWEADLVNHQGESLLIITGVLGEEAEVFQTAVFRGEMQKGLCYNSSAYRDSRESHYFHKLISEDVRKNPQNYIPKGIEIEMRDLYEELSKINKSISES